MSGLLESRLERQTRTGAGVEQVKVSRIEVQAALLAFCKARVWIDSRREGETRSILWREVVWERSRLEISTRSVEVEERVGAKPLDHVGANRKPKVLRAHGLCTNILRTKASGQRPARRRETLIRLRGERDRTDGKRQLVPLDSGGKEIHRR